MNILQMIVGLLLPTILAAQRPLLGDAQPFAGMDLNWGSRTLSGYMSIVIKTPGETAAYRRKLSMAPGFHGAGFLNPVDVGRMQDQPHGQPSRVMMEERCLEPGEV